MIREPRRWRAALRWLAGVLPVQDCLSCRGHSRGALLCGFCRRALPACAASLDRPALARSCGLDRLQLRFDYRPPLDALIQRYKYRGELALAPALAALLPAPGGRPAGLAPAGRAGLPAPPAPPWPPVLIGVPTDPRRLRERGFDHLGLLVRAYAARHGLVPLAATRLDTGFAQAELGRRQRRANLRGAFALAPLPPGAAVLLLDDVLTTGSTLAELADRCRHAGAAWVGAVVLARTPQPAELRPTE